jgi:hypothetical protein
LIPLEASPADVVTKQLVQDLPPVDIDHWQG